MSEQRDVKPASTSTETVGSRGRNVIAVIGIDRYHHWRRLSNAVRDAAGTAELFRRLGFEQVAAPLLDDHATGRAIQSLVTDDLKALGPDDSLVLFYAGHGGTQKHRLGDRVIKTGYLIPVDAQDKVATWIDLEGWLRAVSLLPAKHILVVLDACHSGIALDPIIKWRDNDSWKDEPLSTLKARRSRRIITSALDDQVALDSGPMHGHSLFTGCLIEGLTHGLRRGDSGVTTGSELGLYVQRRVETYPESRQTPDFGTFSFDDRGEMVIPLVIEPTPADDKPEPAPAEPAPSPTQPPNQVVPIAPALEPAMPASVEPGPPPISRPRRPRRSTPILPPLLPPVTPNHVAVIAPTSEPTVEAVARERDRGWGQLRSRRWIAVGSAVLAAVASVLLGYRAFRDKPVRGDLPVDAPPVDAPTPVAAHEHPDAQVVSAESQPAEPARGDCPAGMVRVPAGTFQMGSPAGVGDADEHPQHQVTLSAYCIDKTEVTVNAYAACVAAKGCSAAPTTVKWREYSAADVKLWSRFCNGNHDDRQDHPVNCVDWDQATAYCRWAAKRLPTEAEWEYAARGGDGRKYPWGNEEPTATRLNACGTECVAMAKRDVKVDWGAMYSTSDGWEATAPVGSYFAGVSPFSALDMAGNVWEWTADWYGLYSAEAAENPHGAKAGDGRVLRGGGWFNLDAANVRAADRNWFDASVRDYDIGFRCARGD